MLVKIGDGTSINMTGIQRVVVDTHQEKKTTPGFFGKTTIHESYAVKVSYTNHEGKPADYTLYGFNTAHEAQKVYKEVLSQVKELENVGATQALEEAIRNG